MKKILVAGLFAIGLLAITQQQASAWVNSKFGIGLNWDLQSGGNQILWGAWRNGQPPGPEAINAGPYAPTYRGPVGPGPGPYFGAAPMPQGYPPQGFAPTPQGSFDAQPFAAPYAGGYQMQYAEPYQTPYRAPYAGGYQSPFQFANYPRPSNNSYYYYYPTPSFYYYGW
jgi:hypothetical protein